MLGLGITENKKARIMARGEFEELFEAVDGIHRFVWAPVLLVLVAAKLGRDVFKL